MCYIVKRRRLRCLESGSRVLFQEPSRKRSLVCRILSKNIYNETNLNLRVNYFFEYFISNGITALFNNMRTLDSKLNDECVFRYRQSKVPRLLRELPTTAERAVNKSLSTVQRTKQCSGSSRKPGGAAEHLIGGSEKRICRLSFEF